MSEDIPAPRPAAEMGAAPQPAAMPMPAAPMPAAPATVTAAPAAPPATSEQFTVDAIKERAAEVADRAGEVIEEALDKAQDAVGDAVERATEATKDAAERVVSRIRNNATLPAERGRTTIRNEVVEKIAAIAAREVPGVFDLGGDVARIFSAVRERIGLGEHDADQGVKVRLDGKSAEIELTIVIEFGFVVSSVTDKVREKVISSVESMLGLDVTDVEVIVDDVHIADEGPVGDDAARAAGYNSTTQAIVVG